MSRHPTQLWAKAYWTLIILWWRLFNWQCETIPIFCIADWSSCTTSTSFIILSLGRSCLALPISFAFVQLLLSSTTRPAYPLGDENINNLMKLTRLLLAFQIKARRERQQGMAWPQTVIEKVAVKEMDKWVAPVKSDQREVKMWVKPFPNSVATTMPKN